MPIYSFSEGLQKVIMFLPGTYGTSLVRNHSMGGVLAEMQSEGVPEKVIDSIRDSLDCNLYFFENQVNISVMYVILGVAVAVLVGAYIIINAFKKNAVSG